ncbi:MAG: PAS domain S-box protein [Desulfobacteraceae bacterium]|jgi:PAS domain S-box-containing protein|nr:MAG: PAS domain S-box protein [Desulfobacteraceae bacterium]
MLESPLYNSRIIKSFTEYISKYHPKVDIILILDYAGIKKYQIEDEGHWFTQTQVDQFYDMTVKTTGDLDIARKAGQYSIFSIAAGGFAKYLLWYMTPSAVYNVLEKVYPHASRGSTVKAKKVGPNQAEVIATQNPGVKEKPYQCQNRLGTFEGITKLFTNELPVVVHDTCMHISGDRCVYNIRWKPMPSFTWKRLANYSYLLGILVSILVFATLPPGYSITVFLSVIIISMGVTLYQVNLEKNELETTFKNHGDTANNLVDEINARYNNSILIQEIGQATSNILNIDNLLKFTMETFKKRLDFDRGLIMLANRDKTRLIYKTGYGYNRDEEDLLINTEFHLDNPKSRGPFIVAFKNQQPFLMDDLGALEKIVSERSREFAKRLGVKSFICVPILYEGISEGILVVDNYHSKRPLNQSDLNLFTGIALQLGISINNARSYEVIREREQRFRALSENAPDIIYTLDTEGRFVYVNPAWEKILGYQKEMTIGKLFVDFLKTEDTERFVSVLSYIKGKRQTITDLYVPILHKDGTKRLFHMSCAPEADSEGNLIGVVGIFKDVTDLKKSEFELRESNESLRREIEERTLAEAKRAALERQLRQAQKMEAVGTLAGGLAHDFNNLLMGIQGYATLMLLDTKEGHAHYEKLKNIEKYVVRGANLTKQLLGFARGGKYEIKPTNMNELIKTSSEMFGRTKKEISISIDLESKPWIVQVDQGQIEQVLLNLYLNAAQAMPGGGNIQIETKNVLIDENDDQYRYRKPGRYIRIMVKDAGVGIDEKTKGRIFEPFFTTKEMGRGTGLGLASVYGIVKSHNGFIHVESEVGHGSNFIIHLPASDKAPKKEKFLAETLTMGNETLLVIDDEADILNICSEMLKKLGYNVISAGSGAEAVKVFIEKTEEIDAVILDMVMPEMSGGETFTRLKKIKPDVKVLLASGYSVSEEALRIINDGQGGFIQKPFDIQKVSSKIREILDKQTPGSVSKSLPFCLSGKAPEYDVRHNQNPD